MERLRASGADQWRSVCSETFIPLEAATSATFDGRIIHVRLGDVGISRVDCSASKVARTVRKIREEPRDDLLLNFQLAGGGVVATGSGGCVLPAGGAVVCEADREYELRFQSSVSVLTLHAPRSSVALRDARLRELHGRPIPAGSTSTTVLCHFMLGVLEAAESALEDEAEIAATALSLLALATRPNEAIASAAERATEPTYRLVCAFLEQHATLASLTLNEVAARHRMSRRSLDVLFARHQETPAGYLRSLRLKRARTLLTRPGPPMTVGDIAIAVGFSDASTFSRTFRRTFGVAPDEWRRAQRGVMGESDQSLAITS
jgi:AraC-like DNA-binding protein